MLEATGSPKQLPESLIKLGFGFAPYPHTQNPTGSQVQPPSFAPINLEPMMGHRRFVTYSPQASKLIQNKLRPKLSLQCSS